MGKLHILSEPNKDLTKLWTGSLEEACRILFENPRTIEAWPWRLRGSIEDQNLEIVTIKVMANSRTGEDEDMPPVATFRGAVQRLAVLFAQILYHHGLEATWAIFEIFCKKPDKRLLRLFRDLNLMECLDSMTPPNVQRFVREQIQESDPLRAANLEKRIRRIRKGHRKLKPTSILVLIKPDPFRFPSP